MTQQPKDPVGSVKDSVRTPSRFRRWALRGALGAAAVVLTLALFELLFAVTGLFKPEPRVWVGDRENRESRNFIADERIGWRGRPGQRFTWNTKEFKSSYRLNAQGFRSPVDFDPDDPRKKIVLVGDSFTFATGVNYEDTFGALLEERLGDVVVWNMAMPGFALDQVWLTVRHYALPLQPDLIVVGLFPADFARSLEAFRQGEGFNKPTFHLVEGTLTRRGPEDRPPAVARFLEKRSRIWHLGRRAMAAAGYRWPVGQWWHINASILDKIRYDCAAQGTPVLFVYLPSENWRSFPMLKAYMEATGANYIDLTVTADHPESLFFEGDGHPNQEGHRHIAREIAHVVTTTWPAYAPRE